MDTAIKENKSETTIKQNKAEKSSRQSKSETSNRQATVAKVSQTDCNCPFIPAVLLEECGNTSLPLLRNKEIWFGNKFRIQKIFAVSGISAAIIFSVLMSDIISDCLEISAINVDDVCFT
ncbi:unnamed protein product, partial [Candidula unifasciata]